MSPDRGGPRLAALVGGSAAAEAYRTLMTNLEFAQVDRPARQLAVVSAEPGAGKSTVALNLAATLAQSGTRTCLVDGDFRHPSLAGPLGARVSPGVTNVLMGKVSLDDALQATPVDGLAFLGPGPLPPNPAGLLSSEAMKRLMLELRDRYEAVIYDTPPLGVASDGAILAARLDGALVVASVGRDRRPSLEAARRALEQVRARVVGCVANRVRQRRHSYGYGYYYGRA
ncbi:CpsD/CapB family tyrosine-protein kinase [Limnochorda pilosa]|uniref:Tyrosine protein kinase n=1 Tax=Limnochorda pilosa TaxID=1555112 RepID=A0A0K2SMA2_LIMPI|nr:CpsD/CapB family tyrosine-protein kinase [Limnochorda pilosa]BAS28248.1 tyrosine protein kinase [Limnochorda pilosa]